MKKSKTHQKFKTPIEIPYSFKDQIAEELDCHVQTVRMTLIWYSKSELANKIRNRAKELLIEEANKIQSNV